MPWCLGAASLCWHVTDQLLHFHTDTMTSDTSANYMLSAQRLSVLLQTPSAPIVIDYDLLPKTFAELDDALATFEYGLSNPNLRRQEFDRVARGLERDIGLNISDAWSDSMERPSLDSTTFTHFPKLPIEIRCHIWQYALATRRIVELGRTQSTTSYSYHRELTTM